MTGEKSFPTGALERHKDIREGWNKRKELTKRAGGHLVGYFTEKCRSILTPESVTTSTTSSTTSTAEQEIVTTTCTTTPITAYAQKTMPRLKNGQLTSEHAKQQFSDFFAIRPPEKLGRNSIRPVIICPHISQEEKETKNDLQSHIDIKESKSGYNEGNNAREGQSSPSSLQKREWCAGERQHNQQRGSEGNSNGRG